ncbi:MAG TPA: hypothetical protein VK846_06995 [Candidatus Limnocylindria bacterium]|nr:hypothetical protein [Candidatus Limnocylindria bacterium]
MSSSNRSKIVLIIAVIVLLGISVGSVVTWQFIRQRKAPDLQGFWEGAIAMNNATLRLVVKVEKSPDGGYTATLDSVDQGTKDIPINSITVSNRTVGFRLVSMQAGFEGNLNSRATEIIGEWKQRGRSLPLTFKRTTTPSTIAETLSSSALVQRENSPLQGAWQGTLKAGGIPLRLLVKISEPSPGKFIGTMDSIDQGSRDMPITTVEFSDSVASLDIVGIGGHYEGTMNEAASEIEGQWQQGGRSFRLLLKRVDPSVSGMPDESAYAFVSEKELQGYWNGTLDAAGTILRLQLKIARGANDSYTATLHSLDQGAKDIPATSVSLNDSNVELEWRALRALFHGELKDGKLIGFWQQGPSDFPLEFVRTNRPIAVKPAN